MILQGCTDEEKLDKREDAGEELEPGGEALAVAVDHVMWIPYNAWITLLCRSHFFLKCNAHILGNI